jgi:hypothetical protein
VCIDGGRRTVSKASIKTAGEAAPEALRAAWMKKSKNPILIFENYPFTDRGWYLPAFATHALGETVNATKGISQGEDIWLTMKPDFDKIGIGYNHFMIYFTARMYWGGKDADVDAMFREYCRLFYGPAEHEMRAFFEYGEANWQEMEKDKSKGDRVLELFAAAKAKVDSGSVYGRRLALIDEFLKGLRSKSTQLAKKRGPVPQLRLVGEATSKIVIDGKAKKDSLKDLFAALGKYTPKAKWNGAYYTDMSTGVRASNQVLVYMDTYIMGGSPADNNVGYFLPTTQQVVPEAYYTLKAAK